MWLIVVVVEVVDVVVVLCDDLVMWKSLLSELVVKWWVFGGDALFPLHCSGLF